MAGAVAGHHDVAGLARHRRAGPVVRARCPAWTGRCPRRRVGRDVELRDVDVAEALPGLLGILGRRGDGRGQRRRRVGGCGGRGRRRERDGGGGDGRRGRASWPAPGRCRRDRVFARPSSWRHSARSATAARAPRRGLAASTSDRAPPHPDSFAGSTHLPTVVRAASRPWRMQEASPMPRYEPPATSTPCGKAGLDGGHPVEVAGLVLRERPGPARDPHGGRVRRAARGGVGGRRGWRPPGRRRRGRGHARRRRARARPAAGPGRRRRGAPTWTTPTSRR